MSAHYSMACPISATSAAATTARISRTSRTTYRYINPEGGTEKTDEFVF